MGPECGGVWAWGASASLVEPGVPPLKKGTQLLKEEWYLMLLHPSKPCLGITASEILPEPDS